MRRCGVIKGLTREQATKIARELRLHKMQVYKIYVDDDKLQFNKIDNVPEGKKADALFTGSWDRLANIQNKITQASVAEILYSKINWDIHKINKEKSSESNKGKNTQPMRDLEEYISKEDLERLIKAYYAQEITPSTYANRYQYLFYRRERDIVYLANDVDRVRSSYLTNTQVYDLDRYASSVQHQPEEERLGKLVEHAYKEVNAELRNYWKDLYDEFEDEL